MFNAAFWLAILSREVLKIFQGTSGTKSGVCGCVSTYKDPDNVLMLKGSVRDLALSCTLTAAFASVLRERFHNYVAN